MHLQHFDVENCLWSAFTSENNAITTKKVGFYFERPRHFREKPMTSGESQSNLKISLVRKRKSESSLWLQIQKRHFFAQKQPITLLQFCIPQRTNRPTESTKLMSSTKENFSRAEGSIRGSCFFSCPS